jgi:microcystin-dependent protein
MSTPFFGQLLLASWSYATGPYVPCNGQTMQISQNQALFSLLGTTFGGDGQRTFLLPNLQGRTPVGVGGNIAYGQLGGEETHTLKLNEVPTHNHTLNASATSTSDKPGGNLLGSAGVIAYTTPNNLAAMNGGTLTTTGSNQAHENRQPYLVLNWLIALNGIFPSRS